MKKLEETMDKKKSGLGYATPQEATWTCVNCGEVQPFLLKAINRYMQSMCACQRAIVEQERKQQRMEMLRAFEMEMRKQTYAWLGPRWSNEALAEKTFGNFDTLRQPTAYQAVLAFPDIMTGTLVLYGSYGTGKTHLLAALCQEMKIRETKCRFTTAPNLFAAIQYRIGQNEDYTTLMQKAIETPLLVIDDIDKAKWSEFREEIYFEIIDSRVNAGRPIAISTNKLDDLEKFVGGAVCSRLSISQIAVEMVGADYRKDL